MQKRRIIEIIRHLVEDPSIQTEEALKEETFAEIRRIERDFPVRVRANLFASKMIDKYVRPHPRRRFTPDGMEILTSSYQHAGSFIFSPPDIPELDGDL